MHHVLLIKAPTAPRPGDGIGRHARLKIWCPYGCGGSSPPLGRYGYNYSSDHIEHCRELGNQWFEVIVI